MIRSYAGAAPEPARTGIGLRAPHVAEIMASRPALSCLEVHSENYLGGGPELGRLEELRREYPVSLHGVGLSLGTDGDLDQRHLGRLRALIGRIEPCLVSEHLSWSIVDGTYLNHLLPLPYTEDTLDIVTRHVTCAQEALGRKLLIENPSGYLRFRQSTIPESEFIVELAWRTGCGLLCDVNNIHVTANNLGLDAAVYIDALPPKAVCEIHLAGHSRNDADGHAILIDDHSSVVAEPVWTLYARAIRRFGAVPTVIEWDTDLPELAVLLAEARKADHAVATFGIKDSGAHAA